MTVPYLWKVELSGCFKMKQRICMVGDVIFWNPKYYGKCSGFGVDFAETKPNGVVGAGFYSSL